MARKKIKDNKSNNSKLVVKETVTPKTKEQKEPITPESMVVVNYYEKGAIKIPDYLNNKFSRTVYHSVTTKVRMNQTSVQYLTSEEANPDLHKYGKTFWKNMSKRQRLEANLKYTANGREFDYQIVN